jgi:hypothetical protein
MTSTTDPTNTTTEPETTDPTATPANTGPAAGELVSFPVDALVPHPDNPRASLGDRDCRKSCGSR